MKSLFVRLFSCIFVISSWMQAFAVNKQTTFILISKQELKLHIVDNMGDTVFSTPICIGQNYGNKQKVGDKRTPEGVFYVCNIHNAQKWLHDFGDGNGPIVGAYGPYFIRLHVPGYNGIGIHGTHLPESIGTRASEGCIRLNNEDLKKMLPFVYIPMKVIITSDARDI